MLNCKNSPLTLTLTLFHRERGWALLGWVLLSLGCGTHADSVCENIGDCTTETSDQIKACKQQAKQLSTEASASGCSSQYTSYFSCAADRFQCNGNLASFPGCEDSLSALNSCLSQGRTSNACGELATQLAQCPTTNPPASPVPGSCGAGEVCSARCYLDQVSDVCRPQPVELDLAAQCDQRCPF